MIDYTPILAGSVIVLFAIGAWQERMIEARDRRIAYERSKWACLHQTLVDYQTLSEGIVHRALGLVITHMEEIDNG